MTKDEHVMTAAEIFKKDPADVTEEERKQAKIVNFGLIYGMDYGQMERYILQGKAHFVPQTWVPVFMDVEEDGWQRVPNAEDWERRKVKMRYDEFTSSGDDPKQYPCWVCSEFSSGDSYDTWYHIFLYERPLPEEKDGSQADDDPGV